MEKMVNIYLFGKQYTVPASLTIMKAMEYAGYQLIRGCGCRNGFCGACATIYRVKGDPELKTCLACQTQVQENMYIATLPFFPLVKQIYDINNIPTTQAVINGKYLMPKSQHLEDRVKEIHNGDFKEFLDTLMAESDEQLQERYNNRDIEK